MNQGSLKKNESFSQKHFLWKQWVLEVQNYDYYRIYDQTYFGQLQTYFWQVLSRKVCTSFFLSVLSQHRVHRWGYTVLLLQKIFGFEKPIDQLWVDYQKQ